MSKVCDNKSVGIIIRKGDDFAVILRKNYPVAYAFIAGHLDGDTFEVSAVKEAREEGTIIITELKEKLAEKYHNSCKREGGSWHEWKIFEATKWSGELKASSDAKEAYWKSRAELRDLADRTIYFSDKLGIPLEKISELDAALNKNPEWIKNPGLETVWLLLLRSVGIL